MRKEIRSARWSAIISDTILIGLVIVIIYCRNASVSQLSGEESTTDLLDTGEDSAILASPTSLSLVMSFLQLAIILGELFTGDYLWYSIRVLQKKWNRYFKKRTFSRLKEKAGQYDQLAVQYSEAAQQNNEIIHITGDLERSHLRFKYRSQQNDDFLDPVNSFKRIGFNVKFQGTGKPASNANVFGVLPNGAKTGNFKTDEDGRVVIPMNNGQD